MSEGNKNYVCSFCGKEQGEAEKMIIGPQDACICDECIQVCLKMILIEDPLCVSWADIFFGKRDIPSLNEFLKAHKLSTEIPVIKLFQFIAEERAEAFNSEKLKEERKKLEKEREELKRRLEEINEKINEKILEILMV